MDISLSNITGSSRISSPIKFLNSSGEISPSPLNRVISGLGFNSLIAFNEENKDDNHHVENETFDFSKLYKDDPVKVLNFADGMKDILKQAGAQLIPHEKFFDKVVGS